MKYLVLPLLIVSAIAFGEGPVPILDFQAIDTSVSPCQNFYQYACGRWLKEFQLPGDQTSYWHQSGATDELNTVRFSEVFARYARGDFSNGTSRAKDIGAYFGSCMKLPEKVTLKKGPLSGILEKIKNLKSLRELPALTAELHQMDVNVFFSFSGGANYFNSNQFIGHLGQGGQGLSEKGYYLDDSSEAKETISAYKKHIATIFEFSGINSDSAIKQSEAVFQFEKQLAKSSLSLAEQSDIANIAHLSSFAKIKKLVPRFEWSGYFSAMDVPIDLPLNLESSAFFTGLNSLLKNTPIQTLKAYMLWHLLHAFGESIDFRYEKENFKFWSQAMSGQKEMSPRWKKCTEVVSAGLTDAVGEVYLQWIPEPELTRSTAVSILNDIKSQFGRNLESVSWLDTPTRVAGQEKLSTISQKIGFPEKWQSHDGLVLNPDSLLENEIVLARRESAKNMRKIGKPVDRSEWDLTLFESNAYYESSLNQVQFPLGALVAPAMDVHASMAANFGAIGTTIGHEFTHGFDNSGSQMDAKGNLRDWWSAETKAKYEKSAACLVEQAKKYQVAPELFVDGALTLGETIADQGGVRLAYGAFLNSQKGKPFHADPKVGGLNEAQQFFVAYAQAWCAKRTPEDLESQIRTDEHAPEEYRVNGSLANLEAFAEVYGCRKGDPMAPEKRCRVW